MDDGARLKIRSAYARILGQMGMRDGLVDLCAASSTLKIGVMASELVLNTMRPDRLLLALNCAPPDKRDGTRDNRRNNFFFAKLRGNGFAGGTVNGFEFSYIRDEIESFYELSTTNNGSQFRSLEILPDHIVKFSLEDQRRALIESGALVPVKDSDIEKMIPSIPDRSHVIEVDNFHNVKLFMTQHDRQKMEKAKAVKITFGAESIEFDARSTLPRLPSFDASVTDSLFAAALGTNVLTRRSSSRIAGNVSVPMIATIRQRPAEVKPAYDVPKTGFPAYLDFTDC
jgi:hypothetical protein